MTRTHNETANRGDRNNAYGPYGLVLDPVVMDRYLAAARRERAIYMASVLRRLFRGLRRLLSPEGHRWGMVHGAPFRRLTGLGP